MREVRGAEREREREREGGGERGGGGGGSRDRDRDRDRIREADRQRQRQRHFNQEVKETNNRRSQDGSGPCVCHLGYMRGLGLNDWTFQFVCDWRIPV